MERLSVENFNNLYEDTNRRIKSLYDSLKTNKSFLDEYYKHFISNIITSVNLGLRKKFLSLVEECKTGIMDLKTEVPKFLNENKKELGKFAFESNYNFVKKIENKKVDFTKNFIKEIQMVMSRLDTLSIYQKNKKYKNLLNKFYFLMNNYIKVIIVDKKSDEIMEWLLEKKSPIKGI